MQLGGQRGLAPAGGTPAVRRPAPAGAPEAAGVSGGAGAAGTAKPEVGAAGSQPSRDSAA